MSNRYKPLKPYQWPQDTLRIPNGQGLMPRIDFENGYNVRAEGAVYTTPAPITIGPGFSHNETIIPIEADADFWVSEIAGFTTGNLGAANPALKLRLSDLRTGYSFMNPHVRLSMFNFNNMAALETGVSGAVTHSTLIQPICFTRNGGIRILLDADFTTAVTRNLYLSFIGWKEYTYASQ